MKRDILSVLAFVIGLPVMFFASVGIVEFVAPGARYKIRIPEERTVLPTILVEESKWWGFQTKTHEVKWSDGAFRVPRDLPDRALYGSGTPEE
jgi:hypothetical protein